jgi:hypothetical protein
MGDDERGGIQDQCSLHHLPRVHGRVTDRAALLHLIGDEIVLAIEK